VVRHNTEPTIQVTSQRSHIGATIDQIDHAGHRNTDADDCDGQAEDIQCEGRPTSLGQ
jgi:hypothetical protein